MLIIFVSGLVLGSLGGGVAGWWIKGQEDR